MAQTDSSSPAQAAALLGQLRADLAAARAALEAAARDRDAALAEAKALRDRLAAAGDTATLQARIAELERLVGDPPAESGVEVVQYCRADGSPVKKRFRTSDGGKFKLLPDAQLHQAALDIANSSGVSLDAAKRIVERRGNVLPALRAISV